MVRVVEWHVHLDVEAPKGAHVDDEQVQTVIDALHEYGPAVTVGPRGLTASLAVAAGDQVSALQQTIDGLDSAAGKASLPNWSSWKLTRAEVIEWGRFERELDEPTYPAVVGIAEIAETLGVSRQRASVIARGDAFPEPYAELAAGPVWLEPTVRRFVESWERRPGRPRKETTRTANSPG
jgi:hypothetical protein